ncbi:MAG: serine/threonine-protein kinase [Nocardioidaceae bacterium]
MTAPRIPGYRVIEHLGSGGFADVFLYEQEWPRQKVAIKVVRPDIPLTDREKQLFASEADATARLADHPFIVSVMNAGTTDDGRPYLVMRYCPPPDLGVRVRHNPMPVAEAISTGIKLASAIETAHRSGILHRDVKPSNVLVTSYSEPALTDFGIAGRMHDVDVDNDVRISYPWSPPELLDGRSNGSVASDVYSLGATIWHLLVGRSPFSIPNGDNSTRALTARILHAAPPATQRPDAPPALDRLLQQAMAKQPAYRPQSALELARSLQRIEAAAGFPRTPIAVEGDATGTLSRGPAAPSGDDETRLKPPTVSTSAPRAVATTPEPAEETADRKGRSLAVTLGALLVGALVATVAMIAFVASRRDGDPDPPEPTGPSSSGTQSVLPGAPTAVPQVTGERTGRTVTFALAYPTGVQDGDTWQWKRTDTNKGGRLDGSTLTLTASERLCVQVQLIRDGVSSPAADTCVP